ncbi:glutamate--tRNA ligase [Rhodovarius lipocyclicus]|uniref:glutamate--tRNA ligase n=1 Tax=Rhodovarius lipocyclicus TaxID=268410 RepID=UPI001359A373|nr:glutamate--tRNA ligase [Rhodovarius lipocyclicus]
MTVRTRFAPSPTGFLHVGGARTAYFNALYARRNGGEYLLRIEDTDKSRSTQAAVDQIKESLAWLGLSPDREPILQSTREARHAEVAHELLAKGAAYRAYETAEELDAMRAAAMAEKRPPRYNGFWRDRAPGPEQEGKPYAIRIKAPREGTMVVEDLVQGRVEVKNEELDDLIILRSDGTPTYLHAVVVDDHDMEITHVIRGDDHLTNTFRQCLVFDAMGWERPRFAHIPLIHGADGAKLSKRHGAVSVLEWRDQGILPEAALNALLRLGWGHGDEEIVPRERAEQIFDLSDVGRGASRMDYAKLMHINGVYIRQADPARLAADVSARLGADETAQARILALMPAMQERAKTVLELAEGAKFALGHGAPAPDAKAQGQLNEEGRARLARLAEALAGGDWSRAGLEPRIKAFAEAEGVKLGAVAQPLRAALTGTLVSPPIDAVLAALGEDEALFRIRAAAG